jgi:hypothetical protein
MLIDSEKEKQILNRFFVDLCEAQKSMSVAINQEIDLVDSETASTSAEAANILNKFSCFIDEFDDVLRDKFNVDTYLLLFPEENI